MQKLKRVGKRRRASWTVSITDCNEHRPSPAHALFGLSEGEWTDLRCEAIGKVLAAIAQRAADAEQDDPADSKEASNQNG
ncbi:MAG: hypothetical protein KatS3mg105_4912 [Gemmatales bacterium]|nr:MAG: hypothetical protein KatS3mg105_4912 [Gemmatales bacterium]